MSSMQYLSAIKPAIIYLDEFINRFAFKKQKNTAVISTYPKPLLRIFLRRNIVISQREFERNASFSESQYIKRISVLHESYVQGIGKAQAQAANVQTNIRGAQYWKDEFPLHNPSENAESIEDSIFWMGLPKPGSFNRNGDGIIPIRLIPAISKSHEHFSLLEKEFPSFIEDNYSIYDSCSIVSEFGAWKENAVADKDSIQNIFEVFSGQPTLILLPDIDDDVLTITIKCWDMGEQEAEPFSAEFGSFDLSALRSLELAKLIKSYSLELKKKGLPPENDEIKNAIAIVEAMDCKEKEGKMIGKNLANKLINLSVPNEEINRKLAGRMNSIISAIYICAAAMYADGCCLFEYGSLPSLPAALHKIEGADTFWIYIRDYYIAILNAAVKQHIIRPAEAISIEEKLLLSYKRIKSSRHGSEISSQPYILAGKQNSSQTIEEYLETRILESNIKFLKNIKSFSADENLPSQPAHSLKKTNEERYSERHISEENAENGENGEDARDMGYVWDPYPYSKESNAEPKEEKKEIVQEYAEKPGDDDWKQIPEWGTDSHSYEDSGAYIENTEANPPQEILENQYAKLADNNAEENNPPLPENKTDNDPLFNPLQIPDFNNGNAAPMSISAILTASSEAAKNNEAEGQNKDITKSRETDGQQSSSVNADEKKTGGEENIPSNAAESAQDNANAAVPAENSNSAAMKEKENPQENKEIPQENLKADDGGKSSEENQTENKETEKEEKASATAIPASADAQESKEEAEEPEEKQPEAAAESPESGEQENKEIGTENKDGGVKEENNPPVPDKKDNVPPAGAMPESKKTKSVQENKKDLPESPKLPEKNEENKKEGEELKIILPPPPPKQKRKEKKASMRLLRFPQKSAIYMTDSSHSGQNDSSRDFSVKQGGKIAITRYEPAADSSKRKKIQEEMKLPFNFNPKPAPDAPAMAKKENFSLLRPGDTVFLGKYPYCRLSGMGKLKMWFSEKVPEFQGNSDAQAYPIEWVILEKRGDYALLLSKYAIDAMKFNEHEKSAPWEECTLRSWLNGVFFNGAFSLKEKSLIKEISLNNSTPQNYGKDTVDKVFLLSADEAEKYIPEKMKRIAYPTPYTLSRSGSDMEKSPCWWWLRTMGSAFNKTAFVNVYGQINCVGNRSVSMQGTVRPAIKADISML